MKKNKSIMIVGGCGLIGRQIVQDLIQKNYKIIVCDLENKENLSWFSSISTDETFFCEINVLNKESIDNAIKFSSEKLISIDTCVNLSYPKSPSWGKRFEELSMDEIYKNINNQIGSCILLSQRIMKYYLSMGKGNLILFSSIQGIAAPKFEHYSETKMNSPIEYTASKTGIIGITKWLAKYYKNKNIRINCVCPGGVFDNQDEKFLKKYRESCLSKGMLDAKDLSGIVDFLASENSKYINGQNLIVDDGWSL